jgi:hypothetical protein
MTTTTTTPAARTRIVIPITPVAVEPELVSLYEKQKKIYPRSVHGWFARWRWALVWFTQILFYGLPWLVWNGRPAASRPEMDMPPAPVDWEEAMAKGAYSSEPSSKRAMQALVTLRIDWALVPVLIATPAGHSAWTIVPGRDLSSIARQIAPGTHGMFWHRWTSKDAITKLASAG